MIVTGRFFITDRPVRFKPALSCAVNQTGVAVIEPQCKQLRAAKGTPGI